MGLGVEVFRFGDLNSTHLDDWFGILESNPGLKSPYFHPAYMESCVRAGREVCVSVIDSDYARSFFPFELISKKIAGPVGSVMSDFHGIICETGSSYRLFDIVKLSGLDMYAYDHFLSTQDVTLSNGIIQNSPVIEIEHGYQAYVEDKKRAKSKLFKKINQYKNRIENKVGPLDYIHDCTDINLLHELIRLKSDQYKRTEVIDIFKYGWPGKILEQIFRQKEPDFNGKLSCLMAGGRLLSLHFGMQTNRCFHYWFPAYSVEYSSFSPGIVMLDYITRSVTDEGIKKIDLGKGDNLYKERFSNASTELCQGDEIVSVKTRLSLEIKNRSRDAVRQSRVLGVLSAPIRVMTRSYRLRKKYR